MSKDERIIQNQDNKKTIRHEDYIAGIGKGMAILDSFSSNQHRLNISMAAEKTGLTRAAARRHLLTLEYLGYLESDGHYYYLTPKVLKFSGAYLGAAQLPKVSQPLLNLLTNQTSLICTYSGRATCWFWYTTWIRLYKWAWYLWNEQAIKTLNNSDRSFYVCWHADCLYHSPCAGVIL